ncbi:MULTISPECIES: hypothetical protein [Massilia]|uniref:Lipoprotein n=2 Tax=Massilia TaxID=149698 RepID=A0ABY4AC86_9BURK|nr:MULTISPECIES: hypothetical protein [Massilia]NHZ43576.1 hypothetical protein [Massilia aquatica]UOD32387.1 hypothetical protein INH39_12445 [Massilia violaceinigra]
MVKAKHILALVAVSSLLSACYVVPIDQYPPRGNGNYNNNGGGVAIVPAPAIRPIYTARLYPSNDEASRMGRISGTISNPERGHGEFSFAAGGEAFSGEATRDPGAAKGVANASGNRGGYVRCDYTMTRAEMGSGTCVFSSGARFDMHITQ